jgi:hypothetical protein
MSSNVPPSIQGVDSNAAPDNMTIPKCTHLGDNHLPITSRDDSATTKASDKTQRIDPNAWGPDPYAPKNPPHQHVFSSAELFKIERAPPVEPKSTSAILNALTNLSRSEKWIVWHIQIWKLEERTSSAHDMEKEAAEKKQSLVVLFRLDDKGYLHQHETNWGKDSDGEHIVLTMEGWKYGDVKEAAAINVGEGFEFKRDEERLLQTLVGVWKINDGQCFKDASY